ncbi:MAG TPA: hypothetical protein PLW01_02500 [Agitococcus sp.]|nr:hypothetical protein [Agitococcus sp.]
MLTNKFLMVRGFVAVAGSTLNRAGDFGYFTADNSLVPFGAVGVFSSKEAAQDQCIKLGGVRSIVEVGLNKLTVLGCKEY